MKATQISIFLENKKGRLASATDAITKMGANLRALNIADTSDFGILRIIVDNPEAVCARLKEEGFMAKLTDVLAVNIDDKVGALNQILQIMDKNSINLEYLYVFLGKDDTKAILIVRTKTTDEAAKILAAEGITLLSHKEVIAI